MPEVKLTIEETAVSAFRVYALASGVEEEPSWDALSDADQQRWFVLARKSEALLEELDGQSFVTAAMALAKVWSGSEDFWARLPYVMQLAWNAVARHLAACMDSDEIDTLESLERFWGEWARERSEKR